MQKYADTHKIRSGKWDLVTGNKADINQIAKTAYFASEDLGTPENDSDFLHTKKLLIDQNKHMCGVYNGLADTAIEQLIADIKVLRVE